MLVDVQSPQGKLSAYKSDWALLRMIGFLSSPLREGNCRHNGTSVYMIVCVRLPGFFGTIIIISMVGFQSNLAELFS